MIQIRLWFTILLTALILGCTGSHESVILKFRYLPGTEIEYKLSQTRVHSLMAGDSVMSKGEHTFDVMMTIQAVRLVDDSTLEIRETSRWTETTPNPKDTGKPDTVTASRTNLFHALASGRITNVVIDSSIGEVQSQYIRGVVDQGTPVFPQERVGVGYSWSQTTQVPAGEGHAEATTVYRVTGFTNVGSYDCAIIEYRGNMLLTLAEDPADSTRRSGVDRVMTTGKIYFAHRDGLTVKQTERWEIDGDRRKLVNGEFLPYKATVRFDAELSLVRVDRDPAANTR